MTVCAEIHLAIYGVGQDFSRLPYDCLFINSEFELLTYHQSLLLLMIGGNALDIDSCLCDDITPSPTNERPTFVPSRDPTTRIPSRNPSFIPSLIPSRIPSFIPSNEPSDDPTRNPSLAPVPGPTGELQTLFVCLVLPPFVVVSFGVIYRPLWAIRPTSFP